MFPATEVPPVREATELLKLRCDELQNTHTDCKIPQKIVVSTDTGIRFHVIKVSNGVHLNFEFRVHKQIGPHAKMEAPAQSECWTHVSEVVSQPHRPHLAIMCSGEHCCMAACNAVSIYCDWTICLALTAHVRDLWMFSWLAAPLLASGRGNMCS